MLRDMVRTRSFAGTGEDFRAALVCKRCDGEFELVTNMIRPQNCTHLLGMGGEDRITVTCPHCRCEETEYLSCLYLQLMQSELARINQEIADQRRAVADGIVFVPARTLASGRDRLLCRCECEFPVGIVSRQAGGIEVTTRTNCHWVDDKLYIRCPSCGAQEPQVQPERHNLASLMAFREQLARLVAALEAEQKGPVQCDSAD
jgi:hypothetical protein